MHVSRSVVSLPLCGLAVLALVLSFVLTACGTTSGAESASPSAETDPPSTESQPAEESAGDASAILQVAGDSFAFSPAICIVGEEDIVVQGAGSSTQTGEVAFLDVDFTAYDGGYVGGADIELGTDQPFTSPDDFYRLDPLVDDTGFMLSMDGQAFTVEGAFTTHGAALSAPGGAPHGVLQVSCDGA